MAMAQDPDQGVAPAILRYPIHGGEPEVVITPGAHHDFVELAGGGYATLVADVRTVDGYAVQGDALVEFEPDGSSRTVWTVWDHERPLGIESMGELVSGARDWSHFNSLSLADGAYWLSSYGLGAIYRVDADSGELLAKIGGGNADYHGADDGAFGPQHAPIATAAGVLLFKNGALGSTDAYSEAVEYRLDDEAHAYARAWSYDADQTIHALMLGNVDPVPGGGHLVAWGSAGRATLLDEEHRPIWEAAHPLGSTFAYAHAADELSAIP